MTKADIQVSFLLSPPIIKLENSSGPLPREEHIGKNGHKEGGEARKVLSIPDSASFHSPQSTVHNPQSMLLKLQSDGYC